MIQTRFNIFLKKIILTFRAQMRYNTLVCFFEKGGKRRWSEHISPKSVRERSSTASAREWQPGTAARFLQDAEPKEERHWPINSGRMQSRHSLSLSSCSSALYRALSAAWFLRKGRGQFQTIVNLVCCLLQLFIEFFRLAEPLIFKWLLFL